MFTILYFSKAYKPYFFQITELNVAVPLKLSSELIMPAINWELIKRGSSPIDWCEDNYTVSPYIAEFVNTFSNILFFIIPPLLIQLHKPYAKHCGQGWTYLYFLTSSLCVFVLYCPITPLKMSTCVLPRVFDVTGLHIERIFAPLL